MPFPLPAILFLTPSLSPTLPPKSYSSQVIFKQHLLQKALPDLLPWACVKGILWSLKSLLLALGKRYYNCLVIHLSSLRASLMPIRAPLDTWCIVGAYKRIPHI